MPTASAASAATSEVRGLSGLSGWVASVIEAVGEVGVGLLTAVETVFPPLPSEVVLPLAGFLTRQGGLSFTWVLVAATLGSLLGALVLYGLGARLGRERATALLCRVPLMEHEDVQRAGDWFDRHGRTAVFFGRLIPGVRSLISLPAGATRMPLWVFCVYTLAGSLVWNAVLVGAGAWLGGQWEQVQQYADWLDWFFIALLVAAVTWAVVRRLRSRHRQRRRRADGAAISYLR